MNGATIKQIQGTREGLKAADQQAVAEGIAIAAPALVSAIP
ncbi:hypothetical protein [Alteribacillus bidgolensis]|nr:hypothetical protein [Alteribacillus bidgolensis]